MTSRRFRTRISVTIASLTAVALLATGALPASAIGETSSLGVGTSPLYIAVTPDGTRAYVTNNGLNTVSVINTATIAIVKSIAVGSKPTGIAVSPNGSTVYVTNQVGASVTVIATSTNTVTNTITVGSFPWDVAFTPDSTKAFVTNYLGQSVSVITVATGAVTTIPVADFPQGIDMSADGATAWVAGTNGDSVLPITVATNAVGTPRAVGDYPSSVAISPDGTTIYTSNSNTTSPGTISVLNIATGMVVDTIDVGDYPTHLSLSLDGSTAFVTNYNGNVNVVDLASGLMVDSINTGSFPRGTAVNPVSGRVYIANNGSNTVTELGYNVRRLSGPNRYDTAVAISQEAFPGTAPTVFIATGENYPDALAAGPVATQVGSPLLLTPRDSLPASVAAEIQRLAPAKIVVVGGEPAVSTTVVNQLKAIQSQTVRVSGPDRYATGRAIVDYAFGPANTNDVYIATGTNFPDALSAGGPGGTFSSPVILVNGSASSVDQATIDLITALAPTRVKIVGGTPAVSAGIEDQLNNTWTVQRLAGPDRFATSLAIVKDAYSISTHVVLATGLSFPDALAGTPLAGRTSAALLVVPPTCIPAADLAAFNSLKTGNVVLLGGTPALSAAVAALTRC